MDLEAAEPYMFDGEVRAELAGRFGHRLARFRLDQHRALRASIDTEVGRQQIGLTITTIMPGFLFQSPAGRTAGRTRCTL